MPVLSRLHLVLASILLLAGCAVDSSSSTALTEREAATPSATTSATPTPLRDPHALSGRCYLDLPGKLRTFAGPDPQSRLTGAVLGRGSDVAVFLHQTDGDGLCGWVPYAHWAAQHGVRAIVIDACGYGDSVCSDRVDKDVASWLAVPIAWARQHGAKRVTVVGASMGGTLAAGAGQPAGADAIVNLSGPAEWAGVPDIVTAGRATTVPLLVAAAESDVGDEITQLRQSVDVSPGEVKEFVAWPDEHGWDMLSDSGAQPLDVEVNALGERVLAWIRGDYMAR